MGGLCLGIRNIISLKTHPNNDERSGHREYYQWSDCLLMLRIVIGDIYWKMDDDIDSYFKETLCRNGEVCHRLELLIVNELEFDCDDHDSLQEIPKSVRKVFHSYCDHVAGYIYIRYSRIRHLSQSLRKLFFLDADSEVIDCKFLLDLFPNVNFIYGYDFIFDDTFCKYLVEYLRDDEQRKNRLMYIQFEQFERQKERKEAYFAKEIVTACDAFNDDLVDSDWNLKKSTKWECVKFENTALMERHTVRQNLINPTKTKDKTKVLSRKGKGKRIK